jgi:hypothetical protein
MSSLVTKNDYIRSFMKGVALPVGLSNSARSGNRGYSEADVLAVRREVMEEPMFDSSEVSELSGMSLLFDSVASAVASLDLGNCSISEEPLKLYEDRHQITIPVHAHFESGALEILLVVSKKRPIVEISAIYEDSSMDQPQSQLRTADLSDFVHDSYADYDVRFSDVIKDVVRKLVTKGHER